MAEKKFLDQNGLLYVWNKIKNLLRYSGTYLIKFKKV